MQVQGIDERMLRQEGMGRDWLVFIYEGGDEQTSWGDYTSWAVDSYLLTDAEFTEVLDWLRENLPTNACYSVGVVTAPNQPTTETELSVDWVLGADVLNMSPEDYSDLERRIAEGMLERRDRVPLRD